jgi:predicted ATPase
MITKFGMKGFKRFSEESFEIAPLTILAGLNGSGKTSLIHALLLTQAAATNASDVVHLNGPFGLELGTAEDVRNWKTNESIEFVVHSDETPNAIWQLEVPSEEALYLNVGHKATKSPYAFSGEARAFTYLCAERLGPRGKFDASPHPPENLEIGVRGEYSAQILESLGDKQIEDKHRLHPERDINSAPLLKYELERWLSEIARPVEVDAVRYPGSTVFALRFRSPGGDWVRAPNMGFGVSYALPVILAGLTAGAGGLVIVENPEAHLHPAGQSRMGTFLGWLVSRGVQVIVETHSDHILNGVRRAIGEYKFLNNEKAVVHFFQSGEQGEPIVDKLTFTTIGGMSHWPRGFFDQYQTDVATLGRIRREH